MGKGRRATIESLNRVRQIVSDENADTMSNDELLDACIDVAASREPPAPPSERLEATMASLRQLTDGSAGRPSATMSCTTWRTRRPSSSRPSTVSTCSAGKPGSEERQRPVEDPVGGGRRPRALRVATLHIPLVHAGVVMIDQDGNRCFEVGAVTGKRIQVGSNPLSVSDTNPEVHVGADNLRATVRAAARRFDVEARSTEPDGLEDGGIRHVRRPQRRSAAPGCG